MIVMIVAESHEFDWRQILPGYSGVAFAAWTDPGERTSAHGPDGVGEDVGVAQLEEHGGVIDHGDAQVSRFEAAGRCGWLNVVEEAGRAVGTAGELPSERVEKATGLRSAGVEETLAVEVIGKAGRWRFGKHDLFWHESP
jgi:hypothetical protein